MIRVLSTGSFEENASIVSLDGTSAWIIDPGADAGRIVAELEKNSLSCRGILLTHAHFDHISAIPLLLEKFPGVKVYVHAEDALMFGHEWNQMPPEYPVTPRPENLVESDWPEAFQVLETPGHTRGSVCFYLKEQGVLFSGDTLFAGSVGRTDFPGGSFTALRRSLESLKKLAPETRVIPGHGPETTIGREIATNPYM